MDLWVLYDDRLRPPADAESFIGIDRFGALLYRKRILSEHVREIMRQAGAVRFTVLRDDADHAAALQAVADAPRTVQVVYFPSCFATTDPGAMRLFFRKFRHSQDPFLLAPSAACRLPVLVLPAAQAAGVLRRLVPGAWRQALEGADCAPHPVGNQPELVDLAEPGALVSYLSSTFDVRHFNAISQDPLVVTKRSTDVAKMRKEHGFFALLPERLRLFFLPPVGWEEGDGWAAYRTERLYVPDVSIQWVHRSFDEASFALLLDRVGAFVSLRPVREPPTNEGLVARDALYLGKIDERVARLRQLPVNATVEHLLADCTPHHSVEALVERFRAQWRRLGSRLGRPRQSVSHGDLCFSNILYSRQNRLTKLIDPRGAQREEDLWLDERYDLAKLSHSVLGSYDFINHDLYELVHDRDLGLEIRIDAPGLDPLRDLFRERLIALGHDPVAVRLCEASLFLSMLPLHADVPKKVVAFLLTAAAIMDWIDREAP